MAKIDFAAGKPPAQQMDIDDQPRDNSRTWSPYQTNIFDFAEHGQGNGIVEAVAGSGKSTTIVECLKRVRGSSLFLAFNKAIAEELKCRGVNARTFHSLTYSAVMRARKQNNVESNKLRKICQENFSFDDNTMYSTFACKLVGLARQMGIGCLIPDTPQAWMDIVVHHDIEPEHEQATLGRGMELAEWLLQASNADPRVDFDDLLYFAVKDELVLPKFDFVFVDEAQDTNSIQRAILRKIMHPGTRIIAVGDPSQAIYGFRGSDSNSMNLIASEFNCIKLPLTISYRCPQSVVKYARRYVDHIQAAPNAPEGEVRELGCEWQPTMFKANDLVVCRTTKPIIVLAFQMIRARVPVQVMGREIGQGLINLINKMKCSTLEQLEEKLSMWCVKECQKALAKMEEGKADSIRDKCDAILCLIDEMPEGSTIFNLTSAINSLFDEGMGKTILATIHKAKGLEADHVYWLNSSQCPAKWARQDWQQQQEINLCYVAVTRAKLQLTLIEERN
jgi:DNA helicase-2/ATP-dependent DNA helicase PcrA